MHHDVILFLLSLAVLLGAARLLGELAGKLGFPAVVGEIIAGIVVGKTVFGRIAPGASAWLFPPAPGVATWIQSYTTVAVVLLLVVAGLEIDLTVVRRSSRVVFLTSILGIIVPFALGFGLGQVLPDQALADPNQRGLHAAFLGIALSISALPVIARTLLDLGLMKTEFGLLVLSSAVVDDLIGWVGFSALSASFAAPGSASVGSVAKSLGMTLGFVLVTLAVVRPLADRALAWMEKRQEANTGRVLSMIMVLALLGAAGSEALGMHAVFGGFVMGIAVGDSPRLREHTRKILHDFVTSVFTPVFFATMALRVDFVASFDAKLTLVIILIACIAKILGCAAGARMGRVAWRQSFAIGFGMNSRGAMEILLAVTALQAGIINQQVFVALVIMALFTSILSGPAMSRLLRPSLNPIVSLLQEGAIQLDVPATTREQIIASLCGSLAERTGHPGDSGRFTAAVMKREILAGTGVGEGVALPHAEVEGLTKPMLAFGRALREVDFDAPDGQGARLVFLVLTPPRDFDAELKLMSEIARLLTQTEVREGLLAAMSERNVISVLTAAPPEPPPAAIPANQEA
ncbi:cation:proton antiporter domain-containing protein [Chondromyces apiculatus]|uniref:Putative Na/H antiporter n=1 Tax=Chondromyces apiculatus DSM 436 TaxID=1192034 RepID=A0A017SYS2_9BACT|nr:cation:proton antiporter [Chondromyces apiculatus]EYF02119.1 putative Na/H antiporter [Chondromyces apiculatus DSM 436]